MDINSMLKRSYDKTKKMQNQESPIKATGSILVRTPPQKSPYAFHTSSFKYENVESSPLSLRHSVNSKLKKSPVVGMRKSDAKSKIVNRSDRLYSGPDTTAKKSPHAFQTCSLKCEKKVESSPSPLQPFFASVRPFSTSPSAPLRPRSHFSSNEITALTLRARARAKTGRLIRRENGEPGIERG